VEEICKLVMEMNIRYSFCLYDATGITRDYIYIDGEPYLYTVSRQDNFTEIVPKYDTYGDKSRSVNGRLNNIQLDLDIDNPSKTISKFRQLLLLQ
jgi:hypothetical protein